MSINDAFAIKEKELIGLGASVAAGCVPCTEYHVRSARLAGACDRGIHLAIETALDVRRCATSAMDKWAERCQGSRPELDPEFRAGRKLTQELVSITAAVCVNSVAGLTIHLASARQLGATAEQIRSAIAIARSIKRTAEQKLDAVVDSEVSKVTSGTSVDGRCESGRGIGAATDQKGPACGCR